MKFKVEYIIHKEPGELQPGAYGYSVEFPWLPGCATDGRTIEECHRHAREAAQVYIESQLEDHPDVPLFRVDPWDWMEDPGEKFEMEVEVPAMLPSARQRSRRRFAQVVPIPVIP